MSLDQTLEQRNKTYGNFDEDARMAQGLKYVLQSHKGYKHLPAEQKEALEHICTKMGRIINGDCMYKDNWTDIEGYARLVRKIIEKDPK